MDNSSNSIVDPPLSTPGQDEDEIGGKVEDAEPAKGTIEWAQHQITKVYEPQITGPGADLSKVHELPYVEAAAIFSIEDGGRYERLKALLKGRGMRGSSRTDWERRVREREYQIKAERKQEKAQGSSNGGKPAPGTGSPPTWTPLTTTCQQPVDGYKLFHDIRTAIKQFVALGDDYVTVVALWILFTWIFEKVAETNPYLRVISPEKNCGKSTLFKTIKYLTRQGWLIARATRSAFTRKMEVGRMTMLADEGDAFLNQNEDFRNVLDGASDPDTATVALSKKRGDDWVSVDINCYVPIAIASIKKLRGMETVESRSVHIWLQRATKAERKALTKARLRILKAQLQPIADRCARWALDNADKLVGMQPAMDFEDGREEDVWEPLVGIADYLNIQLGGKVREIAGSIIGTNSSTKESLAVELLADIKKLFDKKRGSAPNGDPYVNKYSSDNLCANLADLDERPWGALWYGKEQKRITPSRLASMLSSFQIATHNVRLADGTVPKGFYRKDFEDAWARYPMPEPPPDGGEQEGENEPLTDVAEEAEQGGKKDSAITEQANFDLLKRYTATSTGAVGESHDFEGATASAGSGSKNGTKPLGQKGSSGVAFQNPTNADFRNAAYLNGIENRLTDASKEGAKNRRAI